MSHFLRSFAVIGIVAVSFIVAPIPASAQRDKELAQELVDGSPWEGTFGYGDTGSSAGTLTVKFIVSEGSLKGEVSSIAGRTTAQPGPLAQLEAKDGQVSFVTPSNGVHYDLHLEDAKLAGRWFGRTSGWITLSSTKQKN